MFDLFAGFAALLGRMFGWLWANGANVQAAKILREELSSEKYSLRSFNQLLEKAGAFDGDPDQLRRLLLSIGARRYRGDNREELWGFPGRNSEKEEEKDYSLALMGVLGALAVCSLAALAYYFLPVKFVDRIEEKFAVIEPIECDQSGENVLANVCYPKKEVENLPQVLRLALYARCVNDGGSDRYTNSCCDHLWHVDQYFIFQDASYCGLSNEDHNDFLERYGRMTNSEIESWAVHFSSNWD